MKDSKQKILKKQNAEKKRRSPRPVSRSLKIIQLSDLPKQNDDDSDYNII